MGALWSNRPQLIQMGLGDCATMIRVVHPAGFILSKEELMKTITISIVRSCLLLMRLPVDKSQTHHSRRTIGDPIPSDLVTSKYRRPRGQCHNITSISSVAWLKFDSMVMPATASELYTQFSSIVWPLRNVNALQISRSHLSQASDTRIIDLSIRA